MKSHVIHKATNKQQKIITELVAAEIEKQKLGTTRRLMKIVCVSLNRKFDFGPVRLPRLIEDIENLLSEEGRESEFWYRVDKLMESLGMDFEKEG